LKKQTPLNSHQEEIAPASQKKGRLEKEKGNKHSEVDRSKWSASFPAESAPLHMPMYPVRR
jgi:hypothetical protein